MVNENDRVMTVSDVAALFKVNPKTVARWERQGKLPSFRTLGGHRRFYESAVRAAMTEADQTSTDR